MSAHPEYFEVISSKKSVDKKTEYKVLRPKGHPLTLMSKFDGNPIVTIFFKSATASTLITKALNGMSVDFQCIINKDNKEFTVPVYNHRNFYMHFGMRQKDGKIINTANCLKPNSVYVIKSNAQTKCALVAKAVIDNSKDNKNKDKKVTVKDKTDDEKKKDLGGEYTINLMPETKDGCKEIFEETYWITPDFLGETHKIIERVGESLENLNYLHECADTWSDSDSDSNINEKRAIGQNNKDRGKDGDSLKNKKIKKPDYFDDEDNNSGSDTDSGPVVQPKAKKMSKKKSGPKLIKKSSSNSSKKEQILQDVQKKIVDTQKGGDNKKSSKKQDDLKKLVENSHVAEIVSGKKLTESTKDIDIEIDFKTNSAPCKIGISVSTTIVFRTNTDADIKKEAEIFLEEYIKNNGKILQENIKIFTSDECAICLETNEEMPLNLIYYNCGHKCTHFECGNKLVKCPICTKIITAFVRV